MEETGLSSWKVFGEQTVVLRCESSNAKQQKKKTDIETVGAVFLMLDCHTDCPCECRAPVSWVIDSVCVFLAYVICHLIEKINLL